MPFISRLRKLGTLSIPELSTTLNVHLINLDKSKDVNIIYTSSKAIPEDATLPPSIHWESPEVRSKAGDVVIWASRVGRKACHVHACWVFDGNVWAKPTSDTEVMMEHPVNSNYQLVVLSGPYVKWEIKPEPVLEVSQPSESPSPSLIASRATINSGGSVNDDSATAPPGATGVLTRNRSMSSTTPDGSAGFTSSSNSPLSDVLDDAVSMSPQSSRHESSTAPHEAPITRPSRNGRTPDYSSFWNITKSARLRASQGSLDGDSRDRQEAHPSPFRQTTPTSTAPPTPVSTRPRTSTRPSLTPLRKLSTSTDKRPRSPALASSRPLAKRRKLDMETLSPTISSPTTPLAAREQSTTPTSSTEIGADFAQINNVQQAHASTSDPKFPVVLRLRPPSRSSQHTHIPIDSVPLKVEINDSSLPVSSLAKQSSPQFTQSSEAADDDLNLEAQRLRDEIQKSHNELKHFHDELERVKGETQRLTDEAQQSKDNMMQAQARWESSMKSLSDSDKEKQTKVEQLIKERDELAESFQAFKAQAAADLNAIQAHSQEANKSASADSQSRAEAKIAYLTRQRDDFARLIRDIKETSEVELRTVRKKLEEVNAVASRKIRQMQLSFATREASVIKESQVERDKLTQMKLELTASDEAKAKQFEELNRNMESTLRRAYSFESSLKVAQEALLRQRTLAQESEERQRGTITQLAKEIKEKDQNICKLNIDIESMEMRIKELESAVSKSESTVLDEKETVRRVMDELDQLRKSSKEDHAVIVRLQESLSASDKAFIATKVEVERQAAQILELTQCKSLEEDLRKKEVDLRISAERQIDEAQKTIETLRQAKEEAKSQCAAERTARESVETQFKAESTRLQQIIAMGCSERDRLNHLLTEARALHIAKEKELISVMERNNKNAANFHETLAGNDRERRRLEELLAEGVSSLNQTVRMKEAEIETKQAECEALEDSWVRYERTSSYQLQTAKNRITSLEATTELLQKEIATKCKEFEEARATSQTILATESGKFKEELSSLQSSTDRVKTALRQQLTELTKKNKELEKQLSDLGTMFSEQSRNLTATNAKLATVRTQLKDDQVKFACELTSVTKHFEQQLTESMKQVDHIRSQHFAAEQKILTERSAYEQRLSQADDEHQKTQSEAVQQIQELKTEKDWYSSELDVLRKVKDDLEGQLAKEQEERKQCEDVLTKHLKGQAESFNSEVSLHKAESVSLRNQLFKMEQEISEVQASLRKQKLGFEDERGKFSAERAGLQRELSASQTRAAELEHQKVDLEAKILASNEDIAQKIASLADTKAELELERKRATEHLQSYSILDKTLQDERSQLMAARELIKTLENQQCQLRCQKEVVTAEAARTESPRLNSGDATRAIPPSVEPSSSEADLEGWREKVASLEANLEQERANHRALQEQTSSEQSANFWSDLASQLLRSLHEAQDKLRAERAARERVMQQLSVPR